MNEKVNCNTEIKTIKSKNEKLASERKNFMRKLELSSDKWLFDFTIKFGNLNEYRKDIISKANLTLKEMLNNICNKYQIKQSEIMNLSYKEILDLINKKSDKNLLILKANLRKKGFVNISLNKIISSYNLNDFEELREDEKIKSKKIEGTNASPGKAVGRIKLIEVNRSNIKPESIIVSSMTSVDDVHLLKSASGIITDEGGISCHAAIIAREFNKPCLVGTERSTKFFKDDEYVFLNSEKGYAEKINKEKYFKLKNEIDVEL